MLAASWSEAVGEPQKVLFVNLIEDLSFAKTPQGPESGPRNNVTEHSACYSFQTHFEFWRTTGEKGILILAPIVRRHPENDQEPDEASTSVAGFRAVYVFDRLSRDLRPSLCALDGFRLCHFRKSPR